MTDLEMTYRWEMFPAPGGGFYSWKDATPGDHLIFRFDELQPASLMDDDPEGTMIPELHGETRKGTAVILSGRPVILRRKLIELAPEPGTWLRVTYLGKEGRANNYDVQVLTDPGDEPF